MPNKVRKQIAAKQAEMRVLKLEEKTIDQISVKLKDQLNRLKIEAMAFDSALLAKTVSNAIQPTSLDLKQQEPVPGSSYPQCSSGRNVVQQSSVIVEQPQEINLLDLDLVVPPSKTKKSYTYTVESSDEDEEDECLLHLEME